MIPSGSLLGTPVDRRSAELEPLKLPGGSYRDAPFTDCETHIFYTDESVSAPLATLAWKRPSFRLIFSPYYDLCIFEHFFELHEIIDEFFCRDF